MPQPGRSSSSPPDVLISLMIPLINHPCGYFGHYCKEDSTVGNTCVEVAESVLHCLQHQLSLSTGLRHEMVKGRRYLAACAFCQKQKMLRQKSPSGVMCSKAPNPSTEVALEDERCEPGEHPRDTQQLPCLLFRQIVLIWQQDLSRNIPPMHGGRTTVQLQYLHGVARNVQI